MASPLVTSVSLALVVVILASILGAVSRRERVGFVLGIALFIVAHAVLPGFETAAARLAVAGLAMAVASTIPLLRQPV
jgi:hypothetical protein